MGFACLPTKGDSRKLLIGWLVVLPYLMAATPWPSSPAMVGEDLG
jgi:hypothetical protein